MTNAERQVEALLAELEAMREGSYGNVYHQDLAPEQEEAVEAAVSGGVVAYLHRLVEGHGFRFHWNSYSDRVGVSVCSCGDPVCHMAYVRLYIDRLISDYERKVEDFAAETRRADAALAEVERLRGVVRKAQGLLIVAIQDVTVAGVRGRDVAALKEAYRALAAVEAGK